MLLQDRDYGSFSQYIKLTLIKVCIPYNEFIKVFVVGV
jgi:hypothetical protein